MSKTAPATKEECHRLLEVPYCVSQRTADRSDEMVVLFIDDDGEVMEVVQLASREYAKRRYKP